LIAHPKFIQFVLPTHGRFHRLKMLEDSEAL